QSADSTLQRGKAQRANLIKRHLSLNVALAERNIQEGRSTTGKKYARSCAQLANPHRAHGNANGLGRGEIDYARQLRRSVGACRHFEKVSAIRFCRVRLSSQPAGRRGGFQMVN